MRSLRESDANSIVQNVGNLEVSKWLLVVPYPYTRKDALFWIKHSKKRSNKKPQTNYVFGIELKSEKAIIGAIGLHKVDRYQGYAEVGYWLGKNYHGKSYGSEALKAVIDFSFNKLKLRRLEAGVFTGNPSSGKLLEKFGFKQEGLKVKARRSKADGQIKDEIFYGLIRENYVKINR